MHSNVADVKWNTPNIIHKQTFGSPMGSPLSLIIADIVLQDLEEKVLNVISLDLPFYYLYVDDIVLAGPEIKVSHILDIFNSFHKRI